MMGVYLIAVHAAGFGAQRLPGVPFDGASWILRVGPVADLAPSLPWFFHQLALLYGCMACVFFLTKFVVRGPWWYGSLSGTLLMAHPLKNEAVLAAGGPWLMIAFLNLLTLTLFAWWREQPARGRAMATVAAFAITVAVEPRSAALLPLMLFYAHARSTDPAKRPLLAGALVVATAALNGWAVIRDGALPDLVTVAQPLLLVLYPLGLLPETAYQFAAYPILLYATLAATLALLAWVAWQARHPAIHWALGSALIWRLLQGAPVDPVHFDGGGRMLVEIALLLIGFAAVCHQSARHPQWRRHIVTLTTLLCLICFVHQFRTVQQWREAGALRAAYVAAMPGRTPVVAWQHYGPAPLRLPLGDLPSLNFARGVRAELVTTGETRGQLTLRGGDAAALLYPAWTPVEFGRWLEPRFEGATVGAATVLEAKEGEVVIRLYPPEAAMPEAPLLLP